MPVKILPLISREWPSDIPPIRKRFTGPDAEEIHRETSRAGGIKRATTAERRKRNLEYQRAYQLTHPVPKPLPWQKRRQRYLQSKGFDSEF